MELNRVRIISHGMFCEHNMPCAVCYVNSAVFHMNTGIFEPCWDCQAKGYQIIKKRKRKFWNS